MEEGTYGGKKRGEAERERLRGGIWTEGDKPGEGDKRSGKSRGRRGGKSKPEFRDSISISLTSLHLSRLEWYRDRKVK